MPIINGQFQQSPLGSPEAAQNAVFGDYTKRDMNDYSTAAYNYLMHQQDQAFALDIWRLQNAYNTPAAQMQRYKDAGLNPNLVYSQQQAGANFSSPSTPSFSPQNTSNKQFNTVMSALGQMRQIAASAASIMESASRNSLRTHQEIAVDQKGVLDSLRGTQYRYLLGMQGTDDDSSLYNSPYAKLYRSQIDLNKARYDQLVAAASLIPDQEARYQALTNLDKYRLELLQGQYGAITQIPDSNGGYILKTLIFAAMNMLPSFSFSGKMF